MEEIVTIKDMLYGEDAIARLKNGKTVFVTGGCPGDKVLIKTYETNKRFDRAYIKEILEPSRFRVKNSNVHAHPGLSWSHILYSEQINQKEKNLISNLKRIGNVSENVLSTTLHPTCSSSNEWNYRNKLEFSIFRKQSKISLGMQEMSFPSDACKFVEVNSSPLLPSKIKNIPGKIQGALRYLDAEGTLQIQRVGIRYSQITKNLEIALWTQTTSFPRNMIPKLFKPLFPTSVTRIMMGKDSSQKARDIRGVESLYGKGYWKERLSGFTYKVSSPSFFQTNTKMAEKMIETLLEFINRFKIQSAIDLYCGVGTFSLPLASLLNKTVCVETERSSIQDLKRNLNSNNLSADVIRGQAENIFKKISNPHDLILVDPPRSGLPKKLIKNIMDSNSKHLLYVSCNPATLGRDIKEFTKNDSFKIISIIPIDMFPQTYHLECMVWMTRNN